MDSQLVLAVDDNSDEIGLVERHLSSIDGVTVQSASSTDKALEKIRNEDFDCIVSDYDMNGVNGLEFYQKAFEIDPDVEFVLFTGKGSEEVASKAISSGVTDYIRKGGPEQYERLVNRVENVLSKKLVEEELESQKEMLESRNNVLKEFHEITNSGRSFDEKVEAMLRLGIDHFGLNTGILSFIEDHTYYVENIVSDQDIEEGAVFELSETFCERVVEMEDPVSFNSEVSDEIREHPAYEVMELEVYLGVPVFVEGEMYGTLNFSSEEQIGRTLDTGEKTLVRIMAEWIGKEIARQKKSREASAKKKRLRQVIDNLPQLVFAKDEEGEFLLANETVADYYGTNVDELEGSRDARFAETEEEVENFREDDRKVLESDEPKHIPEEPLTTASGEKKILETTKIPYSPVDKDGKAVLGVSHDITARKERKERLELQASAMESTLDGISILDEDEEYVYMNDAHAEMFGRSSDYFIGKTWRALYPEGEIERIEDEIIPELMEDGSWRGETRGVAKDGSEVLQEITLTLLDSGKIICTNRNITEQRKSNLKLEEKNRRLDEFSSIVSHDLRNPLNVALGYLDLYREEAKAEDLDKIEKSLNRMKNIIDELMAVSGKSENFEKENISLEDALKTAVEHRSEEISFTVEDDSEIYGSSSGLVSIFDNLTSNSLKHNSKDIEIIVGKTEDGFYYEDTGELEESLEEIQVHGYSSSEQGSGLGISIVKRIAEVNGWEVEISKTDEGGLRYDFKI